MSRSRRKPYIKDKPRNYKRTSAYWRRIRRVSKTLFNSGQEIPNPKSIINDYDYCDYIFISEEVKYTRK